MLEGCGIPLSTLHFHTIAKVKAIHAQGALKQKLFNMGFIPGVEVKKLRAAPLNDPLQFELLDYFVVLRREEANLIEVSIDD